MGELRQEFLKQTIQNLQDLQKESLTGSQQPLSKDFLLQCFRRLHTIKGTSQTFNLRHLAHLADEIENLFQALQNQEITENGQTSALIREGFKHLLKIAAAYRSGADISFPQDFTDQIRKIVPDLDKHFLADFLSAQIPESILSQLAIQEKDNLGRAIKNGMNFYSIPVFFDTATFYEDFKNFREILSKEGEVIAVSPKTMESAIAEVGLQIFFVSNSAKHQVVGMLTPLRAEIEFESDFSIQNYQDNLDGVTSCLADIGTKFGNLLEKNISFERTFEDLEVSPKNLILLKGIASHLLHNAIDHAIEPAKERIEQSKNPTAKIKISVKKAGNYLLLEIEDDGRGLDLAKITHFAKQKGLVTSDQILDEKEALEIIFQPGFSTSEKVSEISGRGIGLDAVKDLVGKSNGTLEIQTRSSKGTTFSIYLPAS